VGIVFNPATVEVSSVICIGPWIFIVKHFSRKRALNLSVGPHPGLPGAPRVRLYGRAIAAVILNPFCF
jgi:hypothetical protein